MKWLILLRSITFVLFDLICFIFYRKNTKLAGNAHVHRNYDTIRYGRIEIEPLGYGVR